MIVDSKNALDLQRSTKAEEWIKIEVTALGKAKKKKRRSKRPLGAPMHDPKAPVPRPKALMPYHKAPIRESIFREAKSCFCTPLQEVSVPKMGTLVPHIRGIMSLRFFRGRCTFFCIPLQWAPVSLHQSIRFLRWGNSAPSRDADAPAVNLNRIFSF